MIIFPIKRTEHLRGNPVIILRYRIAPEGMLRTEQGCIQLLSGNHFHPGAVHQELLFVRIGHHGKFLCRKRRSLYHLGYDGQRAGKIFIQRVYEQVSGILDETYVATDDERIESAVKAFGGKVVMTSVHHKSGTDRCYEAYTKVGRGYDVVVNIQGDEPFIQKSQLEAVKACFEDPATQIATLVKPFIPDDGLEALENVNSPKVVVGKNMNALYGL